MSEITINPGLKDQRMQRVLFDCDQVAEYLGRSAGAVRNLALRRRIPFRKAGGRLIFFKDEIDKWLNDSPGCKVAEIIRSDDHE